MKRFILRGITVATTVILSSCGGGSTTDVTPQGMAHPATATVGVAAIESPAPVGTSRIDLRLKNATGPVEVWVSLSESSQSAYKTMQLQARGQTQQARAVMQGSTGAGGKLNVDKTMLSEMQAHHAKVKAQQASVIGQLNGLGAQVLGRVSVAHNAVAVRVNAASLQQVAQLGGVMKVRPVINYTMDLSETVPYVGASAAQALGKDGTGVRIAVLDSGIDYTHYNLGGPGTLAAYEAAYGTSNSDVRNKTRDGLFPTAKVIDGYDFVGEVWPNGNLAPDEDPIDYGSHGSHVADIIAGHSLDGKHKGVAPGASLLAVKVCSAVASSCSGIALLQGMDFALDPNGDGDTSDAVDVINMSLGSPYGQIEDDLTLASTNAVNLGVVVVSAAGNNGNLPFVVSSPSISPGVISVAQTQVPSASALPLVISAPATLAGVYTNTETVDWAPVGAGVSGGIVPAGRGCPAAGATPEDPYTAPIAGKIAMIDRGACAISLKVDRAAKAGASGVLIALSAPGDAVSFSFGGGTAFVPTLVIQQLLGNRIKAAVTAGSTVTGSISAANAIALVGSMASTSARGPSFGAFTIKPEIGAPGASVSAEVGTGNGQTVFGGTSGATPMVAGAAAILLQAHPGYSPEQIKALLMNSAETQITTNPLVLPGELAPITRIGAGELRVDRALKLSSVARSKQDQSAALSFGFPLVSKTVTIEKKLLIENFSNRERTYSLQSAFRFPARQNTGAVKLIVPGKVEVAAHGSEEIDVKLVIDGSKLAEWTLNGGPQGGNGAGLNLFEFDGYVTLTSGTEKLTVPWHVLPRKSADMKLSPDDSNVPVGRKLTVANRGVAAGQVDVFALTGTSTKVPDSWLPNPGDNFEWIDMRAVGARLAAPGVLQFGINNFGRKTLPGVPAEYDIYIDVDRDGWSDYVLYNAEIGPSFASTGQNAVFLYSFATGTTQAFYYNDADFNSSNVILTVPTAALGITDNTKIDFEVYVFDAYFTGWNTDYFPNMTFTPATPRYTTTAGSAATVAGNSSVKLQTSAVAGGDLASPSQTGLLLMYRKDAGKEADIVKLH
jgi:subtilisin family serine protease